MTLSRVFQSSWWMNSTEALILSGYFRFGETVMCYGQTVVKASQTAAGPLFDASPHSMHLRICGATGEDFSCHLT